MSRGSKKGYYKGAFGEPSYLKRVERWKSQRPRDPVRQSVAKTIVKTVTEPVKRIGFWKRIVAFIKRVFGGSK